MSHAEKCPICFGSGEHTPPENPRVTGSEPVRTCHGCGGKGWVTVGTEYPPVKYEGIPQKPIR